MDDDRELLTGVLRGDESARTIFIKRVSPRVFRLVSRFFRNREDVEDIAQEVFLKIFAKLGQIDPAQNVDGWVSAVTVNTCYDELRRRRRRSDAENDPANYVAPPGRERSEPEAFGKIRIALEQLDPRFRIPLVLKEVEELSVEEIAQTLGITKTNAKIRLFRGRLKLLALMKDGSGAVKP